MDWVVTDKVTMDTINPVSLVCTEEDNFDLNNPREFLKMCKMKIFTDCMEQCNNNASNTANCETGCHTQYSSPSTDPIKGNGK